MTTYHGKVVPGGPPAVRELRHLVVTKVSVGPRDNNGYVLRCRTSGEELLVDAAAEPERLLRVCGEGPLRQVVTTHRHGDHWSALADVLAASGATSLAHEADADAIGARVDTRLSGGDTVHVGGSVLEVVHLVGHTPGSVALLYDDPAGPPHLWTGDSLFPGGPGGTTTPEDFDSLMGDLQAKVFDRLPDETWVYPGHGNDTTLGAERPHLPEWRARGW